MAGCSNVPMGNDTERAAPDYDAGHTVYTGYTLDGTTYEVTRNGYASQTHTFTC